MDPQYLRIHEQHGPIEIDDPAVLAEDLKEVTDELFAQHEHHGKYNNESMFRVRRGKLELFDGGWESSWKWGDYINLWGYAAEYILRMLARRLKKGKVIFSVEPEGNPPKLLLVEKGKVRKPQLS